MNLFVKLKSIPSYYRWWAVAFIQIWAWPQVFYPEMPIGIAVSAFITLMICAIYNVDRLFAAYGVQ